MSSVSDWEATSNPVKENRAGNIGKASHFTASAAP